MGELPGLPGIRGTRDATAIAWCADLPVRRPAGPVVDTVGVLIATAWETDPDEFVLSRTRTLGTGFGIILRNPRLLLLGALPALISAVLLLGGLAALIYYSADLVTWLTPFAANWGDFARRALRILLGVALIGAATLLGSVSFIAVTLLIGGPFYEHIAEQAEKQLGLDTSDDGAGLVRQFGRGVRDSLKLAGITLIGAILVFGIGFIPVAGSSRPRCWARCWARG